MTSFSIVLLVLFIPSYFSSSHQIQIDKYPIWFFIIIFCFLSFYRQNLFCVVCFFLLIIYFWWDFFNYLFFCSKNLGLGRKQNGHYTWVCTQSRPWQTGLDCRYCIPSSCYCADADPLKKKGSHATLYIYIYSAQPPPATPFAALIQSFSLARPVRSYRTIFFAQPWLASPASHCPPILSVTLSSPRSAPASIYRVSNKPSLHRSLFIT